MTPRPSDNLAIPGIGRFAFWTTEFGSCIVGFYPIQGNGDSKTFKSPQHAINAFWHRKTDVAAWDSLEPEEARKLMLDSALWEQDIYWEGSDHSRPESPELRQRAPMFQRFPPMEDLPKAVSLMREEDAKTFG